MAAKKGPSPEQKMLVLIAGLLETRRESPTVREIAALYGCSAPFAMRMIQALDEKSLIWRKDGTILAVSKVRQ